MELYLFAMSCQHVIRRVMDGHCSNTHLALVNVEFDKQQRRVLQAEVTEGGIKVRAGLVPRGVEIDHALHR
jgi:hypothetical protein